MKRYQFFLAVGAFWFSGCASNKVDIDKVGDLRESKSIIEKAKDEGAKKYAPNALKMAEATLDNAAHVMYENKDLKVAEKQTDAAKREARRLLLITRESKMFSSMSGEEIAVWTESKLDALKGPLSLTNHSEESFNKQFSLIHTSLRQTASLGAEAKSLQGRTASLEKEKQLNDRYGEARKIFADEEADVFRSGNNLLVRLKGIQFPSGKADIQPESFVLLTKLQDAIKRFGTPDVTIEGHTDSTGSSKKNMELSQARANNVREYILANNILPEEKISVVGLGSTKLG